MYEFNYALCCIDRRGCSNLHSEDKCAPMWHLWIVNTADALKNTFTQFHSNWTMWHPCMWGYSFFLSFLVCFTSNVLCPFLGFPQEVVRQRRLGRRQHVDLWEMRKENEGGEEVGRRCRHNRYFSLRLKHVKWRTYRETGDNYSYLLKYFVLHIDSCLEASSSALCATLKLTW